MTCGAVVVMWPDDECIDLTCRLPEGHDPDVPDTERIHEDSEMSERWRGWDVDTVERIV